MKRIAFIVQLPEKTSPSQRFRIELWYSLLTEHKIAWDTYSFFDDAAYKIIYKPGNTLKKIGIVLKGFIKRMKLLAKIHLYDYVFIQREASPIGPPFFEWICTKVLKAKVIYDFDDALWIGDKSTTNKIANWFKAPWKIKYVCKWAYKVVAGNNYLTDYASLRNKNVTLIPTCVDTLNMHNKIKMHEEKKVVIGWTGSHSTLKYLDQIVPVLQLLQGEIDFIFLVIADTQPVLQLSNASFIKWNIETEIKDLLQIDIGVMPLPDDKWSEGKCGFKIIQYLSLGIPAVASVAGVNKIIIEEGINGFLCSNTVEWKTALSKLIKDVQLRKTIGIEGRKKIAKQFSTQANSGKFLSLFE